MNRIDSKMKALRAAGRKGFVAFLTAGDPDRAQSEADIRAALDNGVDILELGVPFSDPTADGPVIQAASLRALEHGMNLEHVLDLVRRLRADYDQPIVLFGYVNLFFRYGYERLAKHAAEAGVDGVLVVDLPYEECGEMAGYLQQYGLHRIPLAAPTTGLDRLRMILSDAGGFVYYIMVTGVTGARQSVRGDLAERLVALRSVTELPVAVGFGVSNGEQAAAVAASADAVVVGSALIAAARAGRLAELVREIRAGIDKVVC
ncbi:MAG: tryptophan synthase subunit alpha [Kiritimatiellia bacterium]